MADKTKKQIQPARTGEQNPGNERESSARLVGEGNPVQNPAGVNFFGSPDGRNDVHTRGEQGRDRGHSKPTLGEY